MVPAGFERLLLGHAVAIARSDVATAIRRSMVGAGGSRITLHEFAARHPGARLMQGRGAAYAVPLPDVPFRVVVRHNRHGGLLARFTGDRFLSPTRAPYELTVSLELQRLGVPTADVVAYVLYPPGGLLQRSDVCTREITGGRDLAQVLTGEGPEQRTAALRLAGSLVASLSRAGARHHDLNARNILVTSERAYVLDVDRTRLGLPPLQALRGNLERLERSLVKWRSEFGARVSDDDIATLRRVAEEAMREQPQAQPRSRPIS